MHYQSPFRVFPHVFEKGDVIGKVKHSINVYPSIADINNVQHVTKVFHDVRTMSEFRHQEISRVMNDDILPLRWFKQDGAFGPYVAVASVQQMALPYFEHDTHMHIQEQRSCEVNALGVIFCGVRAHTCRLLCCAVQRNLRERLVLDKIVDKLKKERKKEYWELLRVMVDDQDEVTQTFLLDHEFALTSKSIFITHHGLMRKMVWEPSRTHYGFLS